MGILTAYVNGGPGGGGNDGWIWYPQGDNGVINTGIGATREQICLADINGDNFHRLFTFFSCIFDTIFIHAHVVEC